MTNNTIPNVPRDLLADLLGNDHDKRIMAERHLLAMLANAPSPAGVDADHVEDVRAMVDAQSPAGVDGLEVVGYVSQDDIKWQGDCTLRLKPYSDYTIPLCRLSDAQAIIDGLRGEVAKINSDRLACWAEFKVMTRACLDAEKERDQQAQRVGELEGLLREVAASLAWNAHGECRAIHDGPIMPSQMAIDAVKAALGGSL